MTIEIVKPKPTPDAENIRRVFENGLRKDAYTDSYSWDDDEEKWGFHCGDPEYWKFQDRLLVKGGRLLDLGSSDGRSSIPFALYGMNIRALDSNKEGIQFLKNLASAYDLPIEAVNEDISMADLGEEAYDTVIMSQTFVHFPNKAKAYQVIDRATRALKGGGHLWIRTPGKEDESYQSGRRRAERGTLSESYPNPMYGGLFYDGPTKAYPHRQLDEDTFLIWCDCQGDFKEEPLLFFGQTELMEYFLRRSFSIVHSQIMPQAGYKNIMYGQDTDRGHGWEELNGEISLLVQKP